MIHVCDKIVAPRGIARVSVGAKVVFDSASGGGFTVSIDPTLVTGAVAHTDPRTVTTQNALASPTGGAAPFTYSWAQTSGSINWSVRTPTGQGTTFSCTSVAADSSETATFEVTVTDARGRTAVASVTASAQNYGGLSGGL